MRWNSVSRETSGWRAGTIWMAEAPVPTIATRCPARSASWSQRAEWKTLPGKESRPGISGIFGSDSGPVADTTTSANQRPALVSTSQRSSRASQVIRSTSESSRRCGRSPKTSVTCSR
ncbi:hypothetical protein QF032_003383 [Streptomyces achromogenes]|nr:hypothetical protein [Streptomyces achromogenes]